MSAWLVVWDGIGTTDPVHVLYIVCSNNSLRLSLSSDSTNASLKFSACNIEKIEVAWGRGYTNADCASVALQYKASLRPLVHLKQSSLLLKCLLVVVGESRWIFGRFSLAALKTGYKTFATLLF